VTRPGRRPGERRARAKPPRGPADADPPEIAAAEAQAERDAARLEIRLGPNAPGRLVAHYKDALLLLAILRSQLRERPQELDLADLQRAGLSHQGFLKAAHDLVGSTGIGRTS